MSHTLRLQHVPHTCCSLPLSSQVPELPPSAPGRILTTGSFLRSSFRSIPSLSSTSRLEAEYTEKQSVGLRGWL